VFAVETSRVFEPVPPRRDKWIIAGLLALNIVVRALVAIRPLEYLDGLTIPDDAYLSLTIARNIARGFGPLYGFSHTNGFQPLYVFLMVPAFWIFPSDYFAPIRASFVLLIAFDTLTLYLLYRFIQGVGSSPYPPVIAAIAWIFSPYVIGMTLNGLETAIAVFFVIAALYFFHRMTQSADAYPTTRDFLTLGFLLGLAILARIDTGLLAPSIALVILVQFRNRRTAVLCRSLLFMVVGAAVVVGPWLLYSYAYTRLLFPISGKAVRFNSLADVQHQPTLFNLYLPMMRRAAGVLVRKNGIHIFLLLVSTLLLIRKRNTKTFLAGMRPIAAAFLFAVLLLAAYTGYIFAPWFFDRYLYPVGVVLLLALGIVLHQVFLTHGRTQQVQRGWAVAIVALLVGMNALQPSFRDLFASTDTRSRGYMNLGVWARREFPDGTIIGLQQSGAVGYFADNLRVVNLDGVVNEACYRSLVERRNIEYIKSTGIAYVVCWPVDKTYIINHSTTFTPDDLTLVKEIGEFRSWNERWYVWKVRQPSASSP
jgi:hypothetical protein